MNGKYKGGREKEGERGTLLSLCAIAKKYYFHSA